MSKSKSRGRCFVVSAPSGSGKTTLIHRALEKLDNIQFVTSYTTRAPRAGEVNGESYYFVDKAEFDQMVKQDEFIEWANVHGNLYGTPKTEFFKKIEEGVDIILEIDVQGALNVQATFAEAILLFILPSSPEVLRKRLIKRGNESAPMIERRLETAKAEVTRINGYHYLVVNDDLETAIDELVAIVIANRCRLEYRTELADKWQMVVKAGL